MRDPSNRTTSIPVYLAPGMAITLRSIANLYSCSMSSILRRSFVNFLITENLTNHIIDSDSELLFQQMYRQKGNNRKKQRKKPKEQQYTY